MPTPRRLDVEAELHHVTVVHDVLLAFDAHLAPRLRLSHGAGLDKLARIGFETLGLQTYLTAGPKEARAWTIERGFIKAEVVGYDEIVDAGSMAEAKARGKVRIEGKDYVMRDGDVVGFRFNV